MSRRFALRTIRKGRVRINGRTYEPSSMFLAYDGRLDGKRYAFGLYDNPAFVYLWGTIESYRTLNIVHGPELINGYFPWAFWNRVDV